MAWAPGVQAASADIAPRTWSFRVRLDGRDIGFHRFTLRADGVQRELATRARFDVKMLGFSVYRYAHDATERWRSDCLTALDARTDDNGELTAVLVSRSGSGLVVASGNGSAQRTLQGCVMSFAYWNPAILQQTHLLNAQTGAYEPIQVARLGEETLQRAGASVQALRYRITGSGYPLDLWYSTTDEWLALESVVAGGRTLSYRIE